MVVKDNEQTAVVNVATAEKGKRFQGIQIRFSERRFLLVLVDSLIVVATTLGLALIWRVAGQSRVEQVLLNNNWLNNDLFWVCFLLVGWWALALLNDLYDVPTSYNVSLTIRRLVVVGLTCLVGVALMWLLHSPRSLLWYLLQLLVITLSLIAVWRWVYAISTYRPPFLHRVLILGGGSRGRAVVELLNRDPGTKCTVIGFVDDNDVARQAMAESVPLLGSERELPKLAAQWRVHEVVVAKDRNLEAHIFEELVDCQAQGMRVTWMPNLYGRFYRQTPIEYIDPAWILQAIEDRPIFSRLKQGSKRLIDLIVVVMSLPVLLFVLIPVAVMIRLDSPGPVFYRQIRAGKGGRPFSIFKFRTMVVDAEKDGRARWAEENDPRITRVGRLLRKARLDELPQVLNVLRGEMSLVGPRPERPEFIEELQQAVPFYRTRLMVKPGITGWAQVQYDYGSSAEDALYKLQYDFYYIQYWSLWLDLYILYRTVGVMAKLKGR